MPTKTTQRLHDETRDKVIGAAGEVFAAVGYNAATVREICALANVNIAAVNYHFGDKLGLYTEMLKTSLQKELQPAVGNILSEDTPEEALRSFLKDMFRHLHGADRPAWYTKVMAHELAQPTPGLAVVVECVMRPRALILCGIVGRIIGRPANHPQTRMSAHCVIGQVVHYIHARPVIGLLWPEWKLTPKALDAIANHITDFSLAALHGMKSNTPSAIARKRTSK